MCEHSCFCQELDMSFMRDPKNVMLCVEQCASLTFASLGGGCTIAILWNEASMMTLARDLQFGLLAKCIAIV